MSDLKEKAERLKRLILKYESAERELSRQQKEVDFLKNELSAEAGLHPASSPSSLLAAVKIKYTDTMLKIEEENGNHV